MSVEKEKLVAFQVLLPVSMLEKAKEHADALQLKSVGAYVRQLIASDLDRVTLDAWGADIEPNAGERSTWEGSDFGKGSFLLQVVSPPASDTMTVRVRWRRNGGRGHTNYLTARDLLSGEFEAFGSRDKARRILYIRGGLYGMVESVMGFPGGAWVTLHLHREYPGKRK
jgi:hypothetical protein